MSDHGGVCLLASGLSSLNLAITRVFPHATQDASTPCSIGSTIGWTPFLHCWHVVELIDPLKPIFDELFEG